MANIGYTTISAADLTDIRLIKEAVQAAYDSGYYAGYSGKAGDDGECHRLYQKAIDRRNECFAEIAYRLANKT